VENTQTSLSQAGANSALKATSHNTTNSNNSADYMVIFYCYFIAIVLMLIR